jgi:hypothetical protein
MSSRTVTLAGSRIKGGCHVCAFVNSEAEEDRLLLPFLRQGLAENDKVFQIVDDRGRDERLQRLRAVGIDTTLAERSGQLEVHRWERAGLPDGRFDQDAALAMVEDALRNGRQQFGATRLWASMASALQAFASAQDMIAYEARMNQVTSRFDDVVVCTYDLSRFEATIVMDVLRTHPHVVIGGILQENPFYVPPEELLGALRMRRAAAA